MNDSSRTSSVQPTEAQAIVDMNSQLLTEFESTMKSSIQDMVKRTSSELNRLVQRTHEVRRIAMEEVKRKRSELDAEIQAMHNLNQIQQNMVDLNVGGVHYTTSISTLRRQPNSFLDSMFSGRYELQRCPDGRVFIDRDGDIFSYVLAYLRDGTIPVGIETEVRLLRRLKQEFEFFSLDIFTEKDTIFVAGGVDNNDDPIFSVERYDPLHDVWMPVSPMSTARHGFGLCAVGTHLYAVGGMAQTEATATMEKYDLADHTWKAVASMHTARQVTTQQFSRNI